MQKTVRFALSQAKNAITPGSDTLGLAGAILKMYKAGPTPTPQSVLTDFTECDFSGYVGSNTVAFNPPLQENDGSYSTLGNLTMFNQSATTTTNNVLGALLVNGTDSVTLMAADQFANPVPMNAVGDGFGYVPEINAGATTANDEGLVIQ